MFKSPVKILFLMMLMLGSMITISANSWMGVWMGLEINLLSFIPLMTDKNNLMSNEASLKYFLTQTLASAILLFAIIMMMMKMNTKMYNDLTLNSINLMIMSALLLKSGAAPFHFWFPGVMEGLNWMNSLILMTWQKIAPLMVISYLINYSNLIMLIILLSILIGSLGGLNQTSLRKIMAFSSINHLGWMLTAMLSSESLWLTYFLFYTFLSFNLVYFFNIFKLFHFNQLFSLIFSSQTIKFTLFFNLLSLGGLPPFIGFIPKWLVIQSLTFNYQFFIMAMMITMTLITLFFYLRMCYSAFILNYHENNWMLNLSLNSFSMKIYLTMSFISTFGLFLISLIYLFY